ncbi:hypothetical protein OBBRIDRAFT_789532 [Obba rivulosa]|uniref:Uncharacterized protein n=1 Tax=Obba rivulosa TaxID=1052685 RepID=A0A8E2DR73_9APHY|nr:hypothetical protein OBBRIDRAFT_789532 [Obba rivulosa]
MASPTEQLLVTSAMQCALEQRVRFHDECVLIPDPAPSSRLPRLVTKSYSLPLWRRKGQEPPALSDSEADPKEDEHVVLKVSVPSITRKAQSPTRSASAGLPLVPCLIHHDAHSPPCSPRARRPSQCSPPASPRLDLVTVPLRSCCADCFRTIESCLEAGEGWQERFSRGAKRRRASSVDSAEHVSRRKPVRDAMPGFDAIVAVDEVEKMRKTRGAEREGLDEEEEGEPLLLPSISRRAQEAQMSSVEALSVTPPVDETEEEPPLPELSASMSSIPSFGSSPSADLRTPCESTALEGELSRVLSFDGLEPPTVLPPLASFPCSDTTSTSSTAPIPIPRAREPLVYTSASPAASPSFSPQPSSPFTPSMSPDADGRARRDGVGRLISQGPPLSSRPRPKCSKV